MSQINFEKIFEVPLDLSCVLDLKGNFLKLNPMWQACLGFSLDELKSKPLTEWVVSEDLDKVKSEIEKFASPNYKAGKFELRMKNKMNAAPLVSLNMARHEDLIFCMGHDITSMKQLAEESGLITRRLERVSSNLPGMIYQFALTPQGQTSFTYASKQGFLLFEILEEEYKKDPNIFMSFVHPDDAPLLYELIGQSATQLTPFEWTGRMSTKNQKEKWIHARSIPEKFADGTIIWDGVLIDITNEKTLENNLEEAKMRSILTSKLAALGEMAGGIAHEINNPLAIIVGKTEQAKILLQQNASPTEVMECLDKISVTCERVQKIIVNLRKIIRSEGPTDQVAQPILSLLEETLPLCMDGVRRHNIQLRHNIPDNLSIVCDPVAISQVFINLLNNSIQAVSGQSDRWIEIKAYVKNDLVMIDFTDSGMGIPQKVQMKLFQPFFSTKPTGVGTGIGLSISKEIMIKHGGSLTYNPFQVNTQFQLAFKKSSA